MTRPLCVMVVAAEASGDDRGAGLAQALRRRLGDKVRFVGVGGAQLAREGLESPFDMAELSILGVFEGLKAYPRILRRVRETAAIAARERPDVVVLIDSWGFTIRVARAVRKLAPQIPLVKYVAPQIWAWRPGRAKVLAGAVDHVLSINTLDAPYFAAAGLPMTFVGNAALALDFSDADPDRLRRAIGAGEGEPVLLVLPGSRPSEIERVMPAFEGAVGRLMSKRPGLHVLVAAAPTVANTVRQRVAAWPHRAAVIEGEDGKLDAMKAATVALACSGTVTTELALAGCPMVVGYRLAPMTYAVLRRLVKLPWVTLFNIAARKMIAPEHLQDDCTGQNLARDLAARLDDPALRARQVAAQDEALVQMGRGGPDPSEAAADAILKIVEERTARTKLAP
jgi:lipid-A-disaccharide synthase